MLKLEVKKFQTSPKQVGDYGIIHNITRTFPILRKYRAWVILGYVLGRAEPNITRTQPVSPRNPASISFT